MQHVFGMHLFVDKSFESGTRSTGAFLCGIDVYINTTLQSICMCMYIYMYIYVCIYVYMYIYIRICIIYHSLYCAQHNARKTPRSVGERVERETHIYICQIYI